VEGIMSLLGSKALRRIELRQGLEQLDDGSPTYQGGANLYVRNQLEFAAAWQRHAANVQKLSTQLCSAPPIQLSTTVVGIDTAPHNI
jgi:X-X-X-Leu-X-X-Gly heptad repeat protein